MDKTKDKKEKLLKALEQSKGIISVACRCTKIHRSTYYDWLKNDENFANSVADIMEIQIDDVEDALLKNIQKGDTSAIIFYLKTKGKKRGYTEKQEIDISSDKAIQVEIIDKAEDIAPQND